MVKYRVQFHYWIHGGPIQYFDEVVPFLTPKDLSDQVALAWRLLQARGILKNVGEFTRDDYLRIQNLIVNENPEPRPNPLVPPRIQNSVNKIFSQRREKVLKDRSRRR